ncbi:MAG: GPI inositol-deacylase [Chlorobiales bacterium]|nr:GPI inositol-deacylase [Chlorobiales bacterium]
MNGDLLRESQNGVIVIFIHGILGGNRNSWQHINGTNWPELLKNESDLESIGIYIFTYHSDYFSANYELGDIVDALKEQIRSDNILKNKKIIFVCHSMGGIVARKYLVENANELIESNNEIGLYLLASPSLGSSYANWLEPIINIFGHKQASILKFIKNNTQLSDLDREFKNLKESGRLYIVGKEIIEDKSIFFNKLLKKQVVEPFSGSRYFGEPFKVPKSDHFSIATPENKDAIQHRLLCQFISDLVINKLPHPHLTKRVFSRADNHTFQEHIESLIRDCNHIVLIGTGLTILQKDPFAYEVFERANNNEFKVEIYLADPNSPDVQCRLIEEELGSLKPPVGKSGLAKRLDTLYELWENFDFTDNISINVFRNYPTFALIIIDDNYFIYPYGFARLGNFSPVMSFLSTGNTEASVIKFLDDQYMSIKNSSCNLHNIIKIKNSDAEIVKNLYSFALYVVPAKETDLYSFGTDVLGYDVRDQYNKKSQWENFVGDAYEYGFHLTICDALYFHNESDVKFATAAIEYIVKDFTPFEINNLHIRENYPSQNCVSVVGDDTSGSLEALHFEFVTNVYRRAAASNYSLGMVGSPRDKNSERSRLMIDRYKAPYIIKKFCPHFTLLTKINNSSTNTVTVRLKELFSDSVKESNLRIDSLALMKRDFFKGRWMIEKEIKLG